jgi:pyrophosphatase PpaX
MVYGYFLGALAIPYLFSLNMGAITAVYFLTKRGFGNSLESFIDGNPKSKRLLDELKKRDLLLGIVTSRLRNTTMKYLKSFDLLDYFDVIVTCDDTNVHKPKPEPALIALKQLDVKKDETIMVGDTRFDIGCANNAGIDSVLVNWGVAYRQENLPSEFIPKYVINKPMELLEVI